MTERSQPAQLDPTAAVLAAAGLPCTDQEVTELAGMPRWFQTASAGLDDCLRESPWLSPESRQHTWDGS